MIVNDRADERNYELNGSRKEHKDKKYAPKPARLDLIGLYKALSGAQPWWAPEEEEEEKPSEK